MVESKIRHLVLKLELVDGLSSAHPFVKGFERADVCSSEQEAVEAGRGIFKKKLTSATSPILATADGSATTIETTITLVDDPN